MECANCGKKSDNSRLCRECRKQKETAGAMVSQNKKKLKKLLSECSYNSDWFIKFNLYTKNINTYGQILMKYKETEKQRIRLKIINTCSILVLIVNIFFAFEIAIATY